MKIGRRTRRRAATRHKLASERFDAFVASTGLRRMKATPEIIVVDVKPEWLGITFSRHADGLIYDYRMMLPAEPAESVYLDAKLPHGFYAPQAG